MKKFLLLAVVAFGLFFSQLAFADNVWDMAKAPEYGRKAGGMFGRGLVNVATCFVDIIVQTVHGTQDGPPFVGTLTGLGGGIGCGALRVTSGALDVLTFWVPDFNGIPVSRSYSNCLEEQYDTVPSTSEYKSVPAQPSTYVAPTPVVAAQEPAPKQRDAMDYVKK